MGSSIVQTDKFNILSEEDKEKILDFNYDSFKSFISMSINDFNNFISLDETDKRNLINKLFGNSIDCNKAKPTNSDFIITLSEKIKLDYNMNI